MIIKTMNEIKSYKIFDIVTKEILEFKGRGYFNEINKRFLKHWNYEMVSKEHKITSCVKIKKKYLGNSIEISDIKKQRIYIVKLKTNKEFKAVVRQVKYQNKKNVKIEVSLWG